LPKGIAATMFRIDQCQFRAATAAPDDCREHLRPDYCHPDIWQQFRVHRL